MVNDVGRMIKEWYAGFNSHDLDRSVLYYTDDCVFEDLATGDVVHGKNEMKAWNKQTFTEFPDMQIESKSWFASGNKVASEWIMTGTYTHSGAPVTPAAGKRFSVRGVSILELHDCKVSRETSYWNQADLKQ
jgi:steroid delta-isomerase-like uncharacterized protein